MGLINKNEGEQQSKLNNSDMSSEDQEEIQQSEEHTPAGQQTQRADTRPSRCQLPSHRIPITSTNRAVSHLDILPWSMQWISSLYQLPDVLPFYPEFLLFFEEAFHDMSHCLKAHVKEIALLIIFHFSALSTFYFHLHFLPVLIFLSSFIFF
ncbi:transmembrane protein 31, partial [Marmota marmota marmota]|uniref:transmembrane protein 31 n=1 Tax=Marmota marmota marmota TaxID=9994 RepID=UPI000762A968